MILASGTELLLRLAPLAAATALAAALGVFVFRLRLREHAERTAVWQRFALENRWNLSVAPRVWHRPGNLRMTGRKGELEFDFSTYRVRVGKASQTWLLAASRGPGPSGSFAVERARLLRRSVLGARRVSIDAGDFDTAFLVRSEPPELARELLDEAARAELASWPRSVQLSYAAGNCELRWHERGATHERLEHAVRLHALLRRSFARAVRA